MPTARSLSWAIKVQLLTPVQIINHRSPFTLGEGTNEWMKEMSRKNVKYHCVCFIKYRKKALAPSCRAEFAAKNIKRKEMSVWPEADVSFSFISFPVSSGGFLCSSKVGTAPGIEEARRY